MRDIKLSLSKNEAEILLVQLKEIDARTTTVNWLIKYLELKLKKK